MTLRHITRSLAALLVVLSWCLIATAQDGGQEAMDMDAMMAAMQKYAVPGPEHEHLKKLVGDWNITSQFFMAPDTPPTEGTGTATFEMILDGRWVKQTVQADFMGQTMHGIGYTGYDRFKQQYISTWMDNMSTSMMVSHGECEGDVCTFHCEMDDFMTGRSNVEVKQVARWIDDDTHTFAMYEIHPDGTEQINMEITYKRKK